MKNRNLTYLVSGLLILIFLMLLFVFQVRTTEVAVKTTFGKVTQVYNEPGAYLRWPWPIEQVHRFDRRIQSFEDTFQETLTEDGFNLLSQVYVGWRVDDAETFLRRFSQGSIEEAERSLEGLIGTEKNSVIGRHPFAHFISADEQVLRLSDIEDEILKRIEDAARDRYGIQVEFLGMKRLGIPESITTNVFARMRAERQKEVQRLQGEAEQRSIEIRSKADEQRSRLLAGAEAEAMRIRGRADAEAAKHYQVFSKNPGLAEVILKLNALEKTLQDRTTLVLDQRTVPFDLLSGESSLDGSELEVTEASE